MSNVAKNPQTKVKHLVGMLAYAGKSPVTPQVIRPRATTSHIIGFFKNAHRDRNLNSWRPSIHLRLKKIKK